MAVAPQPLHHFVELNIEQIDGAREFANESVVPIQALFELRHLRPVDDEVDPTTMAPSLNGLGAIDVLPGSSTSVAAMIRP